MTISIKNRHTNEVIHEGDFGSVKECLEDALRKDVKIWSADLSGADLSYANLRYTHGGNHRVSHLQVYPYKLVVVDDICFGGCTKKTLEEWLSYDGDELGESYKAYLETVTKPFIRICIAKRESS